MISLNKITHRIAHLAGADYFRYNAENSPSLRRAKLMQDAGIRLVLDVGAHDGGYGREIRRFGYQGAIVSFEPLAEPYRRLQTVAGKDGNWHTKRIGLGSAPGDMPINVSNRLTSSSLLRMTPAHQDAARDSGYVRVETVRIERLDTVMAAGQVNAESSWLKIDVQGFERHVLDGAGPLVQRFKGIEAELSLVPVYEQAPLIEDMLIYLRERGFSPVSFENVLVSPQDGHVMQLNGIFLRLDSEPTVPRSSTGASRPC